MSSKNMEVYILRYKTIYSGVALILGIIAMISGVWLSSLGYRPEVTGWMLNIFGCTILHNDNNVAPGFFLFLVGLLLIIVTQYRIRINRKPKRESIIDGQTLRYKFIYSMVGLIAGFFSTVFGIILAENRGNFCPADWAEKMMSYEAILFAWFIFFLAGIIILIVTRYRIRIYYRLGEDNIK